MSDKIGTFAVFFDSDSLRILNSYGHTEIATPMEQAERILRDNPKVKEVYIGRVVKVARRPTPHPVEWVNE